jgi:ABC-type protease/lipase transport system fused ATPase/permease subunit
MAQVTPACASCKRARISGQSPFESCGKRQSPRFEFLAPTFYCYATITSMALFAAVSSVCWLTGSIFILEVYDCVMPSGSVETFVGAAILDVALLGDTFIWRCAVHQRAGPRGRLT